MWLSKARRHTPSCAPVRVCGVWSGACCRARDVEGTQRGENCGPMLFLGRA
ncbi:unnamed protein product [Ectocarpus sp. 6 AP-2014]